MPKCKCPCPIYCKYCGRKRSRDDVGHYCKTPNCQWQHGFAVCTMHASKPSTDFEAKYFGRLKCLDKGKRAFGSVPLVGCGILRTAEQALRRHLDQCYPVGKLWLCKIVNADEVVKRQFTVNRNEG